MFAVLETGSKQYRVAAGDTLEVERLDAEAGQTFTFDRVLLINNEGKLSVGSPTVAGAGNQLAHDLIPGHIPPDAVAQVVVEGPHRLLADPLPADAEDVAPERFILAVAGDRVFDRNLHLTALQLVPQLLPDVLLPIFFSRLLCVPFQFSWLLVILLHEI